MGTYKEIQAYVRNKFGYAPKTCWIAHVKEMCGLNPRPAPNRIGMGRRYPCEDKKVISHIKEAFEHFKML
jgi:hypothetical protein